MSASKRQRLSALASVINAHSLILSEPVDYILIMLDEGRPKVQIDHGSGKSEIYLDQSPKLNDGEWHRLDIIWEGRKGKFVKAEHCIIWEEKKCKFVRAINHIIWEGRKGKIVGAEQYIIWEGRKGKFVRAEHYIIWEERMVSWLGL